MKQDASYHTRRFKYFQKDEFKCKCCGENKVDERLIEKLDKARELAKVAFKIVSGYRCEKHNAEVGGAKNSAHLKGLAADIAVNGPQERYRILKALLASGFTRIGIGKTFIHVDMDKSLIEQIIWLYD